MSVCLQVCVCTRLLGAQGGLRRLSGPLELELYVVVCCYVGSRNRTRSSRRAARALD